MHDTQKNYQATPIFSPPKFFGSISVLKLSMYTRKQNKTSRHPHRPMSLRSNK